MRTTLKRMREVAAELRAAGKPFEALECAIQDREQKARQAARLRSLGRAAGRFLASH